jgi:hypothetical protein
MEGKFASEGLQAIDGDDDMLTAMARELVEHKGIGESAANVWRSLGQLRPSAVLPAEDEPMSSRPERESGNLGGEPPVPEPNPADTSLDPTTAPEPSCKISENGQLLLF